MNIISKIHINLTKNFIETLNLGKLSTRFCIHCLIYIICIYSINNQLIKHPIDMYILLDG